MPHFDVFQCQQCGRYWIDTWRSVDGWEVGSVEDAAKMQDLDEDELRAFMKKRTRPFDSPSHLTSLRHQTFLTVTAMAMSKYSPQPTMMDAGNIFPKTVVGRNSIGLIV